MPAGHVAIITTAPEQRQIARVLEFSAATAGHIDWNKIALTARELGAHFKARTTDAGACTVTMFWSYTDQEGGPPSPAARETIAPWAHAIANKLLSGGRG